MPTPIQRLFADIPSKYELINHLLTFGFDILWRKKLVKMALKFNGQRYIDLCSGTGETAVYLNQSKQVPEIYALDFSLPMLSFAKQKPDSQGINFVISDIKSIPLQDNTFDIATITFATRNINLSETSITKSFQEIHRILKPGGRFLNLETSQPKWKPLRLLYHFYIKVTVKRIGSAISGSDKAYTYLSQTIPRFYNSEALAQILNNAGFSKITYKKLFFGVAAIHISTK